jgi:hypothetical protein
MDQRIRWQYHGPVIDPELIVFPEDAGEGLAGKRLDQKVKRRCADGREHWIALGTILYG